MAQTRKPEYLNLPASTTHFGINLLGVACFFAAFILTRETHSITQAIVSILALVIPIQAYEMFYKKRYMNSTAGLTAKRPVNNIRVLIKLLGLLTTLGLIIFLYWLLPEYRSGFYQGFYDFMKVVLPILLLFSWSYFIEMDIRMANPKDGYYMMGCLALGRWKEVERPALYEHLRQWGVKGFFLPLMFTYMIGNFGFLTGNFNFNRLTGDFMALYDYLYGFIFTIDLAFACVGYMFMFKVCDTHIRSAEPTLLGWVAAVICYKPFWEVLFYGAYFNYDDGYYWGHWLAENMPLKILWGSTILALITVYSLATVSLGLRFSNLTFRGLVTNGPYRFSKHPAYVTKCISWWMISIPFISSAGFWDAFRLSLLLAGVCAIYYVRARTEENHLSNYPEYVQYANWMNEHGLLAWLGRLVPYLRYSEERARSWGSRIKHKVDGYEKEVRN